MRNFYASFQVLILGFLMISCGEEPAPGKQVFLDEGMSNQIIDGYWLYLPKSYKADKKWPVILFLQGGAVRDPDPRSSRDSGPVVFIREEGAALPDSFLIINPHMQNGPPEKRQWYQFPTSLGAVVDSVIKQYNGDPKRVYLTGLSLGGGGSWGLAKRIPEKFAAVVPVAGRINCNSRCENLADIPLWITHNMGDPAVEYDYARETVAYFENELDIAFEKQTNMTISSSDKILTSFEADAHDAWTETYRSPALYQWLLEQSR